MGQTARTVGKSTFTPGEDKRTKKKKKKRKSQGENVKQGEDEGRQQEIKTQKSGVKGR